MFLIYMLNAQQVVRQTNKNKNLTLKISNKYNLDTQNTKLSEMSKTIIFLKLSLKSIKVGAKLTIEQYIYRPV